MSRAPSRRDFLKQSAIVAGAAAVPYFWTSPVARAESANDKLSVAAIGVGGRGSGIANGAAKLANMVACCDVDRAHAEKFAAKHPNCKIYGDYRKLLESEKVDAVTIGAPDHWHVKIAIEAMQAGKDVYCEKPLTLTIDEGKLASKVAKATGRVFQVGTQQRSEYKQMFLKAVALARSGRLGDKLTATCAIGGAKASEVFPASEPPAGLDWDFWLGQAPVVPYTKQRCHGTFRWWLEYSGGKLTDWGAHHIDIAQWALGFENSGPVEIEGAGDFPNLPEKFDPVAFFAGKQKLPNSYNTATKFKITLKYKSGSTMIVADGPGNGILLEGDKGRVYVNRGKLEGKTIEELSESDKEWLQKEVEKLYRGMPISGHMANFFDCIKSRQLPISDVFTHHRSMTGCHLCNLAMILKRKLQWDPQREVFVGDDQANALLSRPQRKGYEITA